MAVLVDGPQGRQNLGGASPLTPGRSRGYDSRTSRSPGLPLDVSLGENGKLDGAAFIYAEIHP